jgi:hypothetical protein
MWTKMLGNLELNELGWNFSECGLENSWVEMLGNVGLH